MTSEDAIKYLESELLGQLCFVKDDTPWASAIKESRTNDAVKLIEEQLQTDRDDPQLRFWWVYCQLILKQVPIMALAAPLEDIEDHITSLPSPETAHVKVYLATSILLHQKQHTSLSSHFFEKSVQVMQRCNELDQTTKHKIKEAVECILKVTVEQLKDGARQESVLAEVESALAAISKISFTPLPEPPQLEKPQVSTTSSTAIKSHFSAKSILEIDQEPEPQDQTVISEETSATRSNVTTIYLGTIALIFCGSIYLIWDSLFSDNTLERIAISPSSPSAEQILPTIDQRDMFRREESERIVSDLKALSEKLKGLPSGESQADTVDSSPTNTAVAQATTESSSTNETVINNQPATPPSDEDLYYQPGTFGDPLQKQPRLEPKEVMAPHIEQLDVNSNANRISPPPPASDIKEGTDGRRYGRPIDDPQQSPYNERKDLKGDPVRSHEVEVIEPPVRYKTIAPTDVLSHPSFVSRSLIRLDPDSSILVVAKMGQWLEVRSVQGRRGYVLAQDAVEEIAPRLD